MHKWKRSSEALKEQFKTMLTEFPDATPRSMFGYPCAFINGNFWTGLHEEHIVLRLDEKNRETFCKKYKTTIFSPMPGRTMKEYVVVPETLLKKPKELRMWMETSAMYVKTLPQKKQKKT